MPRRRLVGGGRDGTPTKVMPPAPSGREHTGEQLNRWSAGAVRPDTAKIGLRHREAHTVTATSREAFDHASTVSSALHERSR